MLTNKASSGYQMCMMKHMHFVSRTKRLMMEMATLKLVNLDWLLATPSGVDDDAMQKGASLRNTHVCDHTNGIVGSGL